MLPWKHHEITMAAPWNHQGMAVPWDHQGSTMSTMTIGITMEAPWGTRKFLISQTSTWRGEIPREINANPCDSSNPKVYVLLNM